jgi:formylglycine-generating enzyme required for sulfatase activity
VKINIKLENYIDTQYWEMYMTTEIKSNKAKAPDSKTQQKPNAAIIVAWIGFAGTIIAAIIAAIATLWPSPTPTLMFEGSATPESVFTLSPADTPFPTEAIISPTPSNPLIGKDEMRLLEIPAGQFLVGSKGNEPDESPFHTVYIKAFLIDQTEVTNAMYALCVESRRCDPPKANTSSQRNESNDTFYYGNPAFDSYPVIYVTWNDAKAYCSWAGRRLPTEAEWEKAASWDDAQQVKRLYPWGKKIDCSYANYRGKNNGYDLCVEDKDTTPVGSYPNGASFYGVLDMAGNVWEWVADRYSESYYLSSPSSNPQGPASGQNHVLRGGSFLTGRAIGIRSSDRDLQSPDYNSHNLGFRCAMDATP